MLQDDFTKRRCVEKSSGPRTDPWGRLALKEVVAENKLPILTSFLRSDRSEVNQERARSEIWK